MKSQHQARPLSLTMALALEETLCQDKAEGLADLSGQVQSPQRRWALVGGWPFQQLPGQLGLSPSANAAHGVGSPRLLLLQPGPATPQPGGCEGRGRCYCLPPAAFPHPGARLSDPGRRSGPPRRCAPHFPGRGEGGGRLSTVLAQELPGEVTGSRCSPWPSPLLPSHGGRRALSDRGRGTGDNFTPWAGHAHCWGAGGRGLLRVGGRGPHSPPQGPRCSRRLRL